MLKTKLKILYHFLLDLKVVQLLYYKKWFYATMPQRRGFTNATLKIEPIEDTLQAILEHQKSISRFGDGELRFLLPNQSLVFQPENEVLKARLLEVLHSNLDNHIVAMPQPMASVASFNLSTKYWWLTFLNTYSDRLVPLIDFKKTYGNSFLSRFYLDFTDRKHVKKTIQILKEIWNEKDLLIVEGQYSRLGIGNDLFANAGSVKRILCPSKNAFEFYDAILAQAAAHGKDKLILTALGPTATVLSYDLAKKGYWSLDIGHLDVEYVWMLMKAESKVPIKGKYVAEAKSGKDFELDEVFQKEYEASVVYNFNT